MSPLSRLKARYRSFRCYSEERFSRLGQRRSSSPSSGLKGFTLVELGISLAIVTLITGVVLANYGAFSSATQLSNLAYDVALSMRKAQAYGISVRQVAGSADFAYGLYIPTTAAGATTYILFADLNKNSRYDGNASCTSGTECLERYVLTQGISIKEACVSGPVSLCTTAGTITSFTTLFLRPDPDARFIIQTTTSVYDLNAASGGEIYFRIENPQGSSRVIRVLQSGQISVTAP